MSRPEGLVDGEAEGAALRPRLRRRSANAAAGRDDAGLARAPASARRRARCGRSRGARRGHGATIGWHRDAPAFGLVVGLSLASVCRLRFQRGMGADRQVFERVLEPRSGYVLAGAARWAWQHSIPATKEDRFSITFRTLRR